MHTRNPSHLTQPESLSQKLPVVAAVLTLVALAVLAAREVAVLCQGNFMYSLDDAYIHMAIARNIAHHGVWGVTPHSFSSSSSSILWSIVLAFVFKIAGVQVWAPYLLNIICGALTLIIAGRCLKQYGIGVVSRTLCLIAIAYCTPMAVLALGGMEHNLHVLSTIWFATVATEELTDTTNTKKSGGKLLIAAATLTASRFEGLFFVGIIALAYLTRSRFARAMMVLTAGALPVAVYGIFSKLQGWQFFPNSVLLKTAAAHKSMLETIFRRPDFQEFLALGTHPELLILVLAGFALCAWNARKLQQNWSRQTLLPGLTALLVLIHLHYAQLGWLYRYEAYLVALGLFSISASLNINLLDTVKGAPAVGRLAFAALALITAVPFAGRGWKGTIYAVMASQDRYLEHYIPADFVSKYYNSSRIAVNDLGFLSFYTNARIFDIFGLGSNEPYEFRHSPGGYTKSRLQSWMTKEKAQIGVLQYQWNEVFDRLPENWVHVADINIPRDVVFKARVTGFFAIDSKEAPGLAKNLEEYFGKLDSRSGVKLTIISRTSPKTDYSHH